MTHVSAKPRSILPRPIRHLVRLIGKGRTRILLQEADFHINEPCKVLRTWLVKTLRKLENNKELRLTVVAVIATRIPRVAGILAIGEISRA